MGIVVKWVEEMIDVCSFASYFLPIELIKLLTDTTSSYLLQSYRLRIIEKNSQVENLISLVNFVSDSAFARMESFLDELEAIANQNEENMPYVPFGNTSRLGRLIISDLKIIDTQAKNCKRFDSNSAFQTLSNLFQSRKFHSTRIVKHTLIATLFTIAKRAGYFLPSLSVPINHETEPQELFASLLTILSERVVDKDSGVLLLAIEKIINMIELVKNEHDGSSIPENSYFKHSIEIITFKLVESCCTSRSAAVRIQIGSLLKNFLETFNSPSEISTRERIILILDRLKDIDEDVKRIYFDCFLLVDPFNLLIASKRSNFKGIRHSDEFKVFFTNRNSSFLCRLEIGLGRGNCR